MSKSEISDLSRINLTDDKDLIVNKIKKAKTIICTTIKFEKLESDLNKKSFRYLFQFNKLNTRTISKEFSEKTFLNLKKCCLKF